MHPVRFGAWLNCYSAARILFRLIARVEVLCSSAEDTGCNTPPTHPLGNGTLFILKDKMTASYHLTAAPVSADAPEYHGRLQTSYAVFPGSVCFCQIIRSTSRLALSLLIRTKCFFIIYNLPLSLSPYFLKVSGFAGWQAPFMAQPAHPQPQDDFPFLLLRIILTIIAAITRIKTALMMIVAIFSISHVSIEIPPVSLLQI